VVDAVLRRARGAVTVAAPPDGLPGIPGITHWEGQDFDPALALTRRIYPHHLNSGGMYVACLRREGPLPWPARPPEEAAPLRADPDLTRRFVDWWCRRFDVDPERFAGLHAYLRGGDLWLSAHPEVPGLRGLQAVGLRVLRGPGRPGRGDGGPARGPAAGGAGFDGWKPTSLALMHLAAGARRNVIDLDDGALQSLLAGQRLGFDRAGGAAPVDAGYVALRWRGEVLGCGVVDGRGLRSALPQGRVQELLSCLEAERRAESGPPAT